MYSNQLLFDIPPVMPAHQAPASEQIKSFFVGEVEICYKKKQRIEGNKKIVRSQDSADILRQIYPDSFGIQEHFVILYLDRGNNVSGYSVLASGGITGCVADPRLIFMEALKTNCVAMIISHNHPSGSLKPSRADEEITEKIKNAGKFLDIRVLDHIILADDGHYSFLDEGML